MLAAVASADEPAELDVIEMKDGTVYKGIIVEQGADSFKLAIAGGEVREIRAEDVAFLSKQPNPAVMTGIEGGAVSEARAASSQPIIAGAVPSSSDTSELPPTMARSGLRLQAELTILFPAGDIEDDDTSFAPTARVGYEAVYGNLGLGGGLHLRYTPWQLPTEFDRHSTTEAHIYGRLAFHVGRTVLFGGVSVGAHTSRSRRSRLAAHRRRESRSADRGEALRLDGRTGQLQRSLQRPLPARCGNIEAERHPLTFLRKRRKHIDGR